MILLHSVLLVKSLDNGLPQLHRRQDRDQDSIRVWGRKANPRKCPALHDTALSAITMTQHARGCLSSHAWCLSEQRHPLMNIQCLNGRSCDVSRHLEDWHNSPETYPVLSLGCKGRTCQACVFPNIVLHAQSYVLLGRECLKHSCHYTLILNPIAQ